MKPVGPNTTWRFGLLSIVALACSCADDGSAAARASFRADVVGCWRLAGQDDEPTPALIRIDADTSTSGRTGRGAVRRFDRQGRVMPRDGEGFAFVDAWSTDAPGDSIAFTLSNGLYGSHWVVARPAPDGADMVMRGRSQAFTDVYMPTGYPDRAVRATRVVCPVAEDSVSGAR